MANIVNFFWFRRDLRFSDNVGLYHALKQDVPVIPLFIFDKDILDDLEDEYDARVTFLHDTIQRMDDQLENWGSRLLVKYGKPKEVWKELVETYEIQTVFFNRDYEPYAKNRDEAIKNILNEKDISYKTFKDHVIFEKEEVQKNAGGVYTVFTPYKNKWYQMHESALSEEKEDLNSSPFFAAYESEKFTSNFYSLGDVHMPLLEEMGFSRSSISIPDKTVSQKLIKQYDKKRNFPAADGTSRLGIHFRFGTISIREKARKAYKLNKTYLNELIWRDFYSQILDAFPHVVDGPFREKYALIKWRNDEDDFDKWCKGQTGYPIVDAGMRQLNETGYMHNRVRMITASFLTKHLLIDWRWGEAYFAKKLLDYELSSNNGGWQWAAGTGTDAAPYFRIFNPYTQVEKFDKNGVYLDEWVPERNGDEYPEPIVDHKQARERCLATYKSALEEYDDKK